MWVPGVARVYVLLPDWACPGLAPVLLSGYPVGLPPLVARMVADGHLTDILLDSVYSGVVSLRGLRIILFLAELNDLEIFATDIGNAYLEAHTKEKVMLHCRK